MTFIFHYSSIKNSFYGGFMNIFTLFFHLLFIIPLFFIHELLDKKEENIIEKAIIPTIYIIVLSSIVPSLKNNIFLIVVFEIIFREFYYNYFSNKGSLLNKKEYLIETIISILLSLVTYFYFINEVDRVLPKVEEARPFIWLLVIIFVYNILKKNININLSINESNFINRKKEYVIVEYARLKNTYYRIIRNKNEDINLLTYCIMIYENNKRPKYIREIDKIVNRFLNREIKYGITQEYSNKELTDEESIRITMKELENKYKELKSKDKIKELICIKYNDINYQKDILDIYNELREFNKK